MNDEEIPPPKPWLPTTDVLEAVRLLLPSDFRASLHEMADSPSVMVKIRTLDHETYVAFTGEQRELMAGFGAAIKPQVDEIVASLRALAPA